MSRSTPLKWQECIVSPDKVLQKIKPGMCIFLGTGVAEPRTLVKHLMAAKDSNLQDLELIQLLSFGDAISISALDSQKYRLKTFFSGWVAREAIIAGRVDLIPSRFATIPRLIESALFHIDAAFVQISPPNEAGYCSLGVAVDAARQAMEKARLVVGEINPLVPETFGDTFVPVSDFDLLVHSTEKPIYFPRWPVDEVFDQTAMHVASMIDDGSCLAFSIGPLYEALARHLVRKRHLGIHSAVFTDALMDLIKSGAVSNLRKGIFRGKSLASYAFGTPELMRWLDRNPLVEFQSIETVFSPREIGSNPQFVAVFPARKVDLSGRIALHVGKGKLAASPAETMDFLIGAEISQGGHTIFGLPSRNRKGEPNIRLSVEKFHNLLRWRTSVKMVATEFGVANLVGRSVRERAQALIDIAHPEDRAKLVAQAKADKILYPDQIFLEPHAHLYPEHPAATLTLKGDLQVHFRAIKPSDEDQMRRLFYRFSDESVYYRYFTAVKTMPHARMQEYVNVDFNQVVSIVGLISEAAQERIIAEGRFIKEKHRPYAEVAFVVDEAFQSRGVATCLYKLLIRSAKEHGLAGFTAEVLSTNVGMMKVFGKGSLPVKAELEHGIYHLTIPLEKQT